MERSLWLEVILLGCNKLLKLETVWIFCKEKTKFLKPKQNILYWCICTNSWYNMLQQSHAPTRMPVPQSPYRRQHGLVLPQREAGWASFKTFFIIVYLGRVSLKSQDIYMVIIRAWFFWLIWWLMLSTQYLIISDWIFFDHTNNQILYHLIV